MRYNKIFFVIIISSIAFLQEQETPTENAPADDPNAVEEKLGSTPNAIENKVESIKNLLINPCEGLNEEDCVKSEGCEYNAEDKVCLQPEKNPDTQESGEEESTPIEFKQEYVVSLNLGTSIPFGTNLKNQFDPGLNLQLNFITPFGINLGDTEIKLSGAANIINCTAKKSNYTNYSVIAVGAEATAYIGALSISMGTGLASASGTAMYLVDGEYPEYAMTTAFITLGGTFTLPLEPIFEKLSTQAGIAGLADSQVAFHFKAIEIFGAPTSGGQTSDLISLGISFGYPLLF